MARRLCTFDGQGAKGRTSLDEARRPALHDPRRVAYGIPDDAGTHRRREGSLESRMASIETLARLDSRSETSQEEVHHRAALEWKCCSAERHGEECRSALGSHSLGGTGEALQTRSRKLSDCSRSAWFETGRSHDGRSSHWRSQRGARLWIADRLYLQTKRIRTYPAGRQSQSGAI